ncbi:MAG: DNA adenine methylase [Candidatus Ranarchaeia archaeon]
MSIQNSVISQDLDNFNYEDFIQNKRLENFYSRKITNFPKPFLKWVGGKRQLISQLADFVPTNFNRYFEPFTGAGAFFFYLLPEKATLVDTNKELINTYQVIRDNVIGLIDSLKKHKNEENYYYKIRNLDRNQQEFNRSSKIEKASRTIFLNKCCFNGLYRVNQKGQFNSPFGRYKNPTICDEKNLKYVSKILKKTTLSSGDFTKILDTASKNDFIYFDPPYVPISDSSNFTSYTKNGFNINDQIRLFNTFKELDRRGCKIMMSNSYSKFIINLYNEFEIIEINAKRSINCNPEKRGEIPELLILNELPHI